VKLTPRIKALRNELITELAAAHPDLGYQWAISEAVRITREAIAEAETGSAPDRELTAADFTTMPAEELAALILRGNTAR